MSTITALKTISIPNQDNSQDPKILAKITNEFGIKANTSKGITEALHEIVLRAVMVDEKCFRNTFGSLVFSIPRII